MFLVQSTQLYYFKYVLDKPNLVGLVSTLNFIVLLPALFATTYISKKLGKNIQPSLVLADLLSSKS